MTINVFRCPARCKTTADRRSIKFISLDHNHGVFTATKHSTNSKLTKAPAAAQIKIEALTS